MNEEITIGKTIYLSPVKNSDVMVSFPVSSCDEMNDFQGTTHDGIERSSAMENSNVNEHRYDEDTQSIENINKYKEDMRKRRRVGTITYCSRCIVDRLQNTYLPARISSYIPISTKPLNSNDDEDNDKYSNNITPGRIPLFRGLDRVITGAQPASETVYVCGIKPIRYLWYMLSGSLCDIIQFFIDFALLRVFNVRDPSYCWAIGFGISILFRHTSHRYLIFGDYVGGYWNSLTRMYTGYSITIVISTVFNMIMTKILLLHHYVAWVITLLWTGIVNYFILKRIWTFDGSVKGGSAKSDKPVSLHIV